MAIFPLSFLRTFFVANYNNHINNLDAMVGTLTLLLNVIVEEFNKLVEDSEKIQDQEKLIIKVGRFLLVEANIDLYKE